MRPQFRSILLTAAITVFTLHINAETKITFKNTTNKLIWGNWAYGGSFYSIPDTPAGSQSKLSVLDGSLCNFNASFYKGTDPLASDVTTTWLNGTMLPNYIKGFLSESKCSSLRNVIFTLKDNPKGKIDFEIVGN